MPEIKSPSQCWFDAFMARWKPIKPEDIVKRDKILCSRCGIRFISRGVSTTSLAVAKRSLCQWCYNHPGKKAKKCKKPGRKRGSIGKHIFGTCRLCKKGPVARGKSPTAKQARKLKLCLRCYCSGGSTKLKKLHERVG